MDEPSPKPTRNVWKRRFYFLVAIWIVVTVAMSFSSVRGIAAYPLYVHDIEASGDVAYVMADGPAYWERLRAASDLYHWERVQRIIVLEELQSDGYNFIRKKSDTRYQRSLDYLKLFGVPLDKIQCVPQDSDSWFGSLSEAQSVAKTMPKLKSIVVVTSAPHTRRSKLCFERSLPSDVRIEVYSASLPQESSEVHSPIWIEYAKLAVYLFVA